MKTAGMLLDFKNESCWILGRYIKLPIKLLLDIIVFPLTNMLLEVERPVNVELHCETLKNVQEWKEKRLRYYIGNLLMHQKKD